MLSELQKKDLKYIFHPCSQMKDYEELPPIVITKGEGLYVWDEFGKKYMDCVASWWLNPFGHCNPRINKIIMEQISTLEHIIFANFSHKPAIELSEKIISLAPKGLEKVFFADNGSSGVEVALKLAIQSQNQRGYPNKNKLVTLKNSYHGETIGALSVGDIDYFTQKYRPLIKESIKVQGPDCFKCTFNKNYETCKAECFVHMEKVLKNNHSEVAGVIIEPIVQGAGGMKIYSPIYMKKLRTLTKELNILMIVDEIAMGFGRTGKMFASEWADISPDLMCVGKALTAGYYPMSLVLITGSIYDSFYDDYLKGKSFLHSHSFSGNPIGCRIALEVLNIFQEENMLEQINSKGDYLEKKMIEIFKDVPYIGEIRRIGLMSALEIVQNKKTKERYPSQERVGYRIYKKALENGFILRPLGDTMYFMPAFTITKEEIDNMIHGCKTAIEEYIFNREKEIKENYTSEIIGAMI